LNFHLHNNSGDCYCNFILYIDARAHRLRKPVLGFEDKIILLHANWSAIHGITFVVRKPIHRSTIPRELHAVNRGCGLLQFVVRISFVLKYIIIRLVRRLNKWLMDVAGSHWCDKIHLGWFISHSRHWQWSPAVICARCLSGKIFLSSSKNTRNEESVKSTREAT